jgi:hypothetical protein
VTIIAPGHSFFFNLFNTCVYGDAALPSFGTLKADKSHHTFEIEQIFLEGSSSGSWRPPSAERQP